MKSIGIVVAFICALVNGRTEEIVIRSPGGVWNSQNFAPFLILFPTSSIRYQQVWGASDFLDRIPQGGWITQMALNIDGQSGPFFGTTLRDVQINFSTTAQAPDALSSIFNENIGADETVVSGRGPLPLPRPPPNATSFYPVITFDRPFFFDPNQGNLLMDVWNYEGYTPDSISRPAFSANDRLGDSVSRVYSTSVEETFGIASTVGLVAQFTIIPVPEPSTWAIGAIAIVLAVLSRWPHIRTKGH